MTARAPKPRISETGNSRLAALREPFAPEIVKQRKGSGGKMLDYVAIETVLGRLLDVAPEFNWIAGDVTLIPRVYTVDGEEKVTYTATVAGQLTIGQKVASGVGAMINPDPDMALKSANSEAIKNAAKNGWGVALELWDKDYLVSLDKRRKLAKGSAAALKQAVFGLAVEQLGKAKPTAKEIAAHFGVAAGDLADEETLKTILTKEGLL